MDPYRAKPALVHGLDPLVQRLAGAGVPADAVTLAGVAAAGAGGLFLVLSPTLPALLFLVPVVAILRLGSNLVDGALARSTGTSHPRGELLNELGDRAADLAFFVPVAFLPGSDPMLVWAGVAAMLLASYAGLASRAAGGRRIVEGVASKPARMAVLAACAVGAAIEPGAPWWNAVGAVLLAGGLLTATSRTRTAWRELR